MFFTKLTDQNIVIKTSRVHKYEDMYTYYAVCITTLTMRINIY
ncbi:hypothetical protein NP493_100g06000 [Ridgeia piscesae]|uniref:Uncharacterized protein n=1 Tax=Ridgeia piscesae TaxID=27915 RepID=A0AAD9UHL8_RIDPI|nr:hypothetical protein NP493_100g06000 [Ridgeia piscesae]